MAKYELRLQAHRMRRGGKSVRDIANKLNVSRGTVSVWCRDIHLTEEQRKKLTNAQILAGNKGRMIGAEMNRQKKITSMREEESRARKIVAKFSQRDLLMLGIALYWGEGTKAAGSTTAIANSDPSAILLAKKWFEMLGVDHDLFQACIFIAEIHRGREDLLISFWSRLLKIPREQFRPVVYIKNKPKKVYENHDSYYGVLALRVRKGKRLKYRILGMIETCKELAGVAQLVRAVVS